MSIEIANVIHAMCAVSLQAANSLYLRQNGFSNQDVVRPASGKFVLRLAEPLGYDSADTIPATVDVTAIGTPATMASGAIISNGDVTYGAYAGHVLVQLFDNAGAALDGQAVNVTVKRFPTTT